MTHLSSSIHERFFLLAGLVRHEFWLHGQDPANFEFHADPDTLTLRSIRQRERGSPCERVMSGEELLGDLQPLARAFYKDLCQGGSRVTRDSRPH